VGNGSLDMEKKVGESGVERYGVREVLPRRQGSIGSSSCQWWNKRSRCCAILVPVQAEKNTLKFWRQGVMAGGTWKT